MRLRLRIGRLSCKTKRVENHQNGKCKRENRENSIPVPHRNLLTILIRCISSKKHSNHLGKKFRQSIIEWRWLSKPLASLCLISCPCFGSSLDKFVRSILQYGFSSSATRYMPNKEMSNIETHQASKLGLFMYKEGKKCSILPGVR